MLTARAISVTGIILGSSLVAVAIAGEVTDCQTSVTRKDGDLAHWSWRTIDGKQCWYRGARWKAKHELRWTDATPSVAGQPEIDNRVDGLVADHRAGIVRPALTADLGRQRLSRWAVNVGDDRQFGAEPLRALVVRHERDERVRAARRGRRGGDRSGNPRGLDPRGR